MTDLRKAAEMALKALEHIDWEDQSLSQVEAKEALRQALAQPEPEPVGQMCLGCGSTMSYERLKEMYPQAISCCPEREMVNVYTAPPRKKWVGLTDEGLRDALHTCPHDTVENLRVRWLYAKEFARAIEAAHGIGEQK